MDSFASKTGKLMLKDEAQAIRGRALYL
jgi:hypothetical protein